MWKLEKQDLRPVRVPYVTFHNPLEEPEENKPILMAVKKIDGVGNSSIIYIITEYSHPFLTDKRGYYRLSNNYYLPHRDFWLGWVYLSDFDNFVEQY